MPARGTSPGWWHPPSLLRFALGRPAQRLALHCPHGGAHGFAHALACCRRARLQLHGRHAAERRCAGATGKAVCPMDLRAGAACCWQSLDPSGKRPQALPSRSCCCPRWHCAVPPLLQSGWGSAGPAEPQHPAPPWPQRCRRCSARHNEAVTGRSAELAHTPPAEPSSPGKPAQPCHLHPCRPPCRSREQHRTTASHLQARHLGQRKAGGCRGARRCRPSLPQQQRAAHAAVELLQQRLVLDALQHLQMEGDKSRVC